MDRVTQTNEPKDSEIDDDAHLSNEIDYICQENN